MSCALVCVGWRFKKTELLAELLHRPDWRDDRHCAGLRAQEDEMSKIDDAADKVKNATDKAAQGTKDAAKTAGEKIKNAGDQIKKQGR